VRPPSTAPPPPPPLIADPTSLRFCPHSLARGELATALDLLSVLSAPRDPPDVDVASLPLPQQTLSFVPTAPPPRPSTDPQQNPLAPIPLASSLDALSRSARAFFSASEELVPLSDDELAALASSSSASDATSRPRPRQRVRAPDPWPTILRLHHGGARTLVPLGAGKGASLAAGKGESRTARSVGVFFGAQEAGAGWRRGSVAEVGELLEEGADKRRGRRMVVEVGVEGAGKKERLVWDDEGDEAQDAMDEGEQSDEDRVERVLKARGRSVFAEELFSQVRPLPLALFHLPAVAHHHLLCSSRARLAPTTPSAPSCSSAAAPRATRSR